MSKKNKPKPKPKKKHKDIHHIIPKSIAPELADEDSNKVVIDEELHRRYHLVFENMHPHEVLDFLVNYFWNGKVVFLHTYLKALRDSEELSFEHFLEGG